MTDVTDCEGPSGDLLPLTFVLNESWTVNVTVYYLDGDNKHVIMV